MGRLEWSGREGGRTGRRAAWGRRTGRLLISVLFPRMDIMLTKMEKRGGGSGSRLLSPGGVTRVIPGLFRRLRLVRDIVGLLRVF